MFWNQKKKKRLKLETHNILYMFTMLVIYDNYAITSCLADFVNKKKTTQKSFSSCQSKLLSVDKEVLSQNPYGNLERTNNNLDFYAI